MLKNSEKQIFILNFKYFKNFKYLFLILSTFFMKISLEVQAYAIWMKQK